MLGLFSIFLFFFFKQKTAYDIRLSLVGSEMCIRDSFNPTIHGGLSQLSCGGLLAGGLAAWRSTGTLWHRSYGFLGGGRGVCFLATVFWSSVSRPSKLDLCDDVGQFAWEQGIGLYLGD